MKSARCKVAYRNNASKLHRKGGDLLKASIFKDYKIRLRGHPNVPLEKLLAQCINALPDNFHLSNNDLKADIENSFCVIYRQSSVGIQALMNGVPAIHLNIDAPLSCDPIMDLEVCKWTVRSPEGFSAVLQCQT